MQIAITGDVHLRKQSETPARYNALVNIFDQLSDNNILELIIAGDLFDAQQTNYHAFDTILHTYPNINVYLIPGNHDTGIRQTDFASENLRVFTEPTVKQLDQLPFLFIPYSTENSMGQAMASQHEKLPGKWILIGHGDFLESSRKINPYEPGTYMPLTGSDIEYYHPAKVILGHIHQYYSTGKVHYAGSPSGLNIHETGRRRFLVMDTEDASIFSYPIETDHIYFNETIISMPIDDEFGYIERQIQSLLEQWNLNPEEKQKAIVNLQVRGYTSNMRQLNNTIKEHLAGVSFYKSEGPDLSNVSVTQDPEFKDLIDRISKKTEHIEKYNKTNATREAILEAAMDIILK
jgi:DNA repair exonuclease SbcCD nuclease subunit